MEKVEEKTNTVENNKKVRNSNFELLRIIAMVMIVIYHYSVHTKWTTFTYENMCFNIFLTQIMRFWGKIGCYLFMLITGYFMINKKIKFKKVFYLALEMELYSVVIFLLLKFVNGQNFSKIDIFKYFVPVVYGNWFVSNYIMFYFLIPIINKILLSLGKNDFKKLLTLVLIIYIIIPSIFYVFGKGEGFFGKFDFMIVSYILGAYINLYGLKRFERKKFCRITICICLILMVLQVCLFDGITLLRKNNRYIEMATTSRFETSIFVMLISISLFYLFKNKNINSKIINFIAPSTLGIYLIHDNMILKDWLWNKFYPNNDYLFSNMMIVHFLIKVTAVFIACLIIDIIRRYLLEKPLTKVIDKTYEKIENISKKAYNKIEKSI